MDKIPQTDTPANLLVEQPTEFELVINLKALALAIPASVLVQADQVID